MDKHVNFILSQCNRRLYLLKLLRFQGLSICLLNQVSHAWHTAGWCTTASHRYERCWSGASRLPTARSSLQAAYSQHRLCGALVPAEAGPNFAAWWAGVHVCEQLTQGCYAVCLGRGSNSRPSDRELRALTIEPPRHTLGYVMHYLSGLVFSALTLSIEFINVKTILVIFL